MTSTIQPILDLATEADVLLSAWSREERQTLVSRKLVIDRLLDLRNIVSATERTHIDAILSDVPGVTVVEGSWWADQVDALRTRLTTPKAGAPA